MKRLAALGLQVGDAPLPSTLLEACHEGRLVGGLSLSLRATPDEVIGALAHVMGGPAKPLKVLDVKEGEPPVLEISVGGDELRWPTDSLEDLLEHLNEHFGEHDDVKLFVVLGEWEDMLQVWALPPHVLETLLETSLLATARNRAHLEALFGLAS